MQSDANTDLPAEPTLPGIAEPESALPVPASFDAAEVKRALEAVLMAAAEPIPLSELKRVFDGEIAPEVLTTLLDELRDESAGRSIELARVASGYRYRVRPHYQRYLDKLANEKPPKYSRAVLETLAIIAYRQPVTRGDIEGIRGVQVSPHILKTLQDRGWIDEIGHKEVVGRPALFATTRHFLDDLNLKSLDELPPLGELATTLDLTQAGAALTAGETLQLPGVGTSMDDEPPQGVADSATTAVDGATEAASADATADESAAPQSQGPSTW
ncbi:MAG: SMC-Scp complex subunit ScpB [Betaproteobacteria bacterium]|nr:SMC-Scp complex subunit ScpB [Betaproteobacteria bacterium]